MSPGTSFAASIFCNFPSRMTSAFNDPSFLSASIAFSALYSWMNPKIALRMRIEAMTIASMNSL